MAMAHHVGAISLSVALAGQPAGADRRVNDIRGNLTAFRAG
jgi:hypothetical protein